MNSPRDFCGVDPLCASAPPRRSTGNVYSRLADDSCQLLTLWPLAHRACVLHAVPACDARWHRCGAMVARALAMAALLAFSSPGLAAAQLITVQPTRGVPGDTVTLTSATGGLAGTRAVHFNRAQLALLVATETSVTAVLPPAIELTIPVPGTSLDFTVTLADQSTLTSEGFLLFADQDVRLPPAIPTPSPYCPPMGRAGGLPSPLPAALSARAVPVVCGRR